MRNISILLSILCISFSIFAQPNKDEESERKQVAANKIKTITQWSYRFSEGKPNPTGAKTTVTNYDKNGNPIEITNFKSNGEISSRLVYKYNAQNLKIEYVQYQKFNKNSPLEITYKQSFHYNSKGLKTQEVVFDGGAGYRILYEYYPDDQLKEIQKFGAGNRIEERWVYSYKDLNQEISLMKPDKVLSSMQRKEFNSKKKLLSDIRLDNQGNEQRRIVYKYDSKDRMIEMEEFYAGKSIKKMEYRHNDFNLVTEVIQHNIDGTKFSQSKYNYDTKGNLVEEKWSEGKTSEFSHKQSLFDNSSNLIETESYFAPYKYRVLYKYTYEYYK
jgi:hypothetical protein